VAAAAAARNSPPPREDEGKEEEEEEEEEVEEEEEGARSKSPYKSPACILVLALTMEERERERERLCRSCTVHDSKPPMRTRGRYLQEQRRDKDTKTLFPTHGVAAPVRSVGRA
jgi:hypothetical protein